MYVGEHNMDERTGLGKMVYPDGAEYGGHWTNGVLVEVLDSLDFSQVEVFFILYILKMTVISSLSFFNSYLHFNKLLMLRHPRTHKSQ